MTSSQRRRRSASQMDTMDQLDMGDYGDYYDQDASGSNRRMFLEPEDPMDLIAMEDRSQNGPAVVRVAPPPGFLAGLQKPNLDLDVEVRLVVT